MEEAGRVAEELSNIVPGRVVNDVRGYLKDWWPLFSIQEEGGNALAAVRPLNVDEVSKVVKFATSNGLALVCRGGGSSVTGSSIPIGGIVVDMTGMKEVLDIDEAARTVTVQAGIKLNELEAKVNAKGFTIGQVPQSFDLATVGGYISTMGTGQYSTLYGSVEDSVLRLQIVLPDGEVIWTRKNEAPRSSVGPDLTRLFMGAEGVFGIVSAAQLKLYKRPSHTWKGSYIFEDFVSAANLARRLLDLDVQPAVCRVYNEVESSYQFSNAKPMVLLVYHFASASVMKSVVDEVQELMQTEGTPGDPVLIDKWMEQRFAYREQLDAMKNMGYMVETAELAAKWPRVFDMYGDVMTELQAMEGVQAVGAHLSHLYRQGACAYFTIILRPEKSLYYGVWNALGKITQRHGATISHHHGVGILKAGIAGKETSLELLRKIKAALDPEGSMNPKKFV
jgi:alkyldihydroxyacetonephosphate synthase